jgi:mannitol/fructose-specific phosphotransferase system IIA component (Ntr-type)
MLAPPTLSDLLAPDRVRVRLPAATKGEVLDQMVALVAAAPAVRDADQLGADVRAREAEMSTGVGAGLALPHARTPAVARTVAAFATLAGPVDYDALDGAPVQLVLLLAGPEGDRAAHVRLLGRVSLLLADEAVRARLLAADAPAGVLGAIREAEAALV